MLFSAKEILAQANKLNQTEARVLRAYEAPRTEKQGIEYLENNPAEDHHRHIRVELKKIGLLRDLDPEKPRGPVAHRYVATVRWDIDQCGFVSRSLPEIELKAIHKKAHAKKIHKVGSGAPDEAKKEISPDKMFEAMLVLTRIDETLALIKKVRLLKRKRKIEDLCGHKVQPVVKYIWVLRQNGFDLIIPSEFFAKIARKQPFRINRAPLLRAEPLDVGVSDKGGHRLFPTMNEWQEYLKAVKKDLQVILRIDIVFNREILGFLLANGFKGADLNQIVKEIDNLYRNEHKGSDRYSPTSFLEITKKMKEQMKIEAPELFNKTHFCVPVGSPIPIHRQYGFTEIIPEHARQIDEMLKLQLKCKEAPPLLCLLSYLVLSLKQDGLIRSGRSGKYYVTDQGVNWVHDFDEDFLHIYFPTKPDPFEKECSMGRPIVRSYR